MFSQFCPTIYNVCLYVTQLCIYHALEYFLSNFHVESTSVWGIVTCPNLSYLFWRIIYCIVGIVFDDVKYPQTNPRHAPKAKTFGSWQNYNWLLHIHEIQQIPKEETPKMVEANKALVHFCSFQDCSYPQTKRLWIETTAWGVKNWYTPETNQWSCVFTKPLIFDKIHQCF